MRVCREQISFLRLFSRLALNLVPFSTHSLPPLPSSSFLLSKAPNSILSLYFFPSPLTCTFVERVVAMSPLPILPSPMHTNFYYALLPFLFQEEPSLSTPLLPTRAVPSSSRGEPLPGSRLWRLCVCVPPKKKKTPSLSLCWLQK